MFEKSQEKIMQQWEKGAPCQVSIVCTTYNQEQYLREALDSFLMQETSFPFEIIVHDDASTDNTQEIITAYCSRYPALIIPILQSENQYSKGKFKPSCYAASYANGRFVALCEGDDYWTSEKKLQRQYEALDTHSNIDLCFHSYSLTSNGARSETVSKNRSNGSIALDEVVRGGGAFCHTGSLFVRKTIFDALPEWFNEAPVGDYYIQILSSVSGGAYYLDECMSSYRVLSEGSWTSKIRRNVDSTIAAYERHLFCLDKVKGYLDPKNTACIEHACAMEAYSVAVAALYGQNFHVCRDYVERSFNQGGFLAFNQLCIWTMTRNKALFGVFVNLLARVRK